MRSHQIPKSIEVNPGEPLDVKAIAAAADVSMSTSSRRSLLYRRSLMGLQDASVFYRRSLLYRRSLMGLQDDSVVHRGLRMGLQDAS